MVFQVHTKWAVALDLSYHSHGLMNRWLFVSFEVCWFWWNTEIIWERILKLPSTTGDRPMDAHPRINALQPFHTTHVIYLRDFVYYVYTLPYLNI